MSLLGLKLTLFVGAATYAAFIATFLYLNDYLLYFGSALVGFGAALIWTAQERRKNVFGDFNETTLTKIMKRRRKTL